MSCYTTKVKVVGVKKYMQHSSDNNLSHSMVHYLFSIHKLKEKNGYARVTDIAKEMNLTKGSVSTALNNLKRKELILEDENKFFTLTDKGHGHVHHTLTSRTLLYYFLKDFIGVSQETAHNDSCLIEHLISDETREKFFDFMKTITNEENQEIAKVLDIKTDLDLNRFSNSDDFIEIQIGNSYLSMETVND